MVRRRRRAAHGEPEVTDEVLQAVRRVSSPLRSSQDLDPLMDRIGEAKYVLLGEASHGTHEFYTWRTEISKRLIRERGFSFVAVEGDWPDCYRVNRFAKGYSDAGGSAEEVLRSFDRWPTWMWANREVEALANWLRERNANAPEAERVGFYGLDVYSLWDSLYQVLGYLSKNMPESLHAATKAFQCFEPYGEDAQDYARATRWVDASCEDEVIAMLQEFSAQLSHGHDSDGHDGLFNAQQNARVVKEAEQYYRAMVQGGPESWNVRDRHMVDTLERLIEHHGPVAKAIVWEHNTHVGDARYTDMADDGMVSVGQMVREAHAADDVAIVGFGTNRGSVIAGDAWDAPMRPMNVPPARAGSWDDLLYRVSDEDQLLIFDRESSDEVLLEERGQRAIGVVYRPQYEAKGNYVPTVLPRRYDALLYIREAHALQPLGHMHAEYSGEPPETYPTGF